MKPNLVKILHGMNSIKVGYSLGILNSTELSFKKTKDLGYAFDI